MYEQPGSVREQFGILFVGVARRWRAAISGGLAESGLTDATWAPLVHLGRSGGGLSQTDLASRVGVSGSTLVRLIDQLDSKGLIERRQCGDDRRQNHLFLTAEGEALVARIDAEIMAIENRMLAGIPDDRLLAAVDLLQHIDMNVRPRRGRRRRAATGSGRG